MDSLVLLKKYMTKVDYKPGFLVIAVVLLCSCIRVYEIRPDSEGLIIENGAVVEVKQPGRFLLFKDQKVIFIKTRHMYRFESNHSNGQFVLWWLITNAKRYYELNKGNIPEEYLKKSVNEVLEEVGTLMYHTSVTSKATSLLQRKVKGTRQPV